MRTALPTLISRKIRELYHGKLAVGDRLPSERLLARKFEVSLPTLREALALLAQEGWIKRRQGSGNYIARPEQESRHIAILMEMDFAAKSLSSSAVATALRLKRRLEEQGRPFKLYFGDRTPHDLEHRMLCREFLHDVEHQKIKAVVAIAALAAEDWMKPLAQQGVPIIGPNSFFDLHLTINRERWIAQAVAYLKSHGKRRIGLVYWNGNRPLNPGMLSYGAIFEAALKKEGLEFDADLVRSDLHPSLDGSGWEAFREIWLRDRAERPEGMIITDEMLFESGLRAIADQQLHLPDDLLIAALTSNFQTGRDWERAARFEWSVEQKVDLTLRALDLPPSAYPATLEVPLTLRFPQPSPRRRLHDLSTHSP
ncbi:MAG TPA: GntR family transcriptional regulator [Chthoniobacteraceae bacterium]|nr:GntR family transcriptional regulator [Chthoniobacteraceae bacterium]